MALGVRALAMAAMGLQPLGFKCPKTVGLQLLRSIQGFRVWGVVFGTSRPTRQAFNKNSLQALAKRPTPTTLSPKPSMRSHKSLIVPKP